MRSTSAMRFGVGDGAADCAARGKLYVPRPEDGERLLAVDWAPRQEGLRHLPPDPYLHATSTPLRQRALPRADTYPTIGTSQVRHAELRRPRTPPGRISAGKHP